MATNTPSTAPTNSIGNNTSNNNFPASVAVSPSSPSSASTNNHTTTASKIAASITNVAAISSSSTSQQQQQNQQSQQRLSNNNLDTTYTTPFQTITSPQTTSSSTTPINTTQPLTGSNVQQTGGTTNSTNSTTTANTTTNSTINNNNNSTSNNSSSSSSSSSSSVNNSNNMMMTPATGSLLGLKPSSAVIAPSSQQSKKTGEQKRPMNAFLMFCKRHRSLVREKHPSLENRGITKILGDWWSKLDKGQKSSYTELARQHKEAFMKANPDFKWYKTTDLRPPINRNTGPASPVSLNMASVTDMISNSSRELLINNNNVDPNVPVIIGPYVTKNNADCATVNTTNSVSSSPKQTMNSNVEKNALTVTNNDDRQHGAPKPPKKRYLENSQHMLASSSSNDLQQQNNEDAMMTNDTIVPIFFDKVTFDRVIEHALSDNKSSNSTPSSASCNDLVNNIKPPLCGIMDQINSQQSTNNLSSSISNDRNANKMVEDLGGNVIGAADLSIGRKQSIDEPVDFSMNRTYEATNQKIINNLIDRMLSDSRDSTSSLSNNTSQPMDQDPQPNQQPLQQSSSSLTSNGTNSSNHPSCNVHLIAATNNSSFTNKSSLPEFDLEKKLTELPLFELTNGKFEGIDQRQHDGLATLAEAAVAVQQLPPQLPQHQIQQQQKHNPHSINVVKNDSATSLATLAAVAGQTPNSVVPAASFKD